MVRSWSVIPEHGIRLFSIARAPTMARMELDGKHVVVTGAARGIGAALARRFHQAGARVVVADREGLVGDPRRVARLRSV